LNGSPVYPVCLDIRGKLCIVIGGGKVASRKVKGLLAGGAAVRLISPAVESELAGLIDKGQVEWQEKPFAAGDLDQAFLVFAATDDPQTQERVWREAEANGQLVNVVDDPGCCNFQVPASFRRGDLTISVSTNGRSPAVAAMIRRQLEESFGPEYEVLLAIMAMVRRELGTGDDTQAERKKIYKKILHDDIVEWIRTGKVETIRAHLRTVLGPDMHIDVDTLKLEIS